MSDQDETQTTQHDADQLAEIERGEKLDLTPEEAHDLFEKFAEGALSTLGIVWNRGDAHALAQAFIGCNAANGLGEDALVEEFMLRTFGETG